MPVTAAGVACSHTPGVTCGACHSTAVTNQLTRSTAAGYALCHTAAQKKHGSNNEDITAKQYSTGPCPAWIGCRGCFRSTAAQAQSTRRCLGTVSDTQRHVSGAIHNTGRGTVGLQRASGRGAACSGVYCQHESTVGRHQRSFCFFGNSFNQLWILRYAFRAGFLGPNCCQPRFPTVGVFLRCRGTVS